MKRLICILSALFLCSGTLRAQTQPTLSLDFEDGVNALGRGGTPITARLEGKTELVDGKFGKAFKSGPSAGYLHFPTKDVLRLNEGTVEMWVQPLDWDGTEQKFHVFFDVRGDGAIYLYKFWSAGLLLLTAPDVDGPMRSAMAGMDSWKQGEWHHIAATWSSTQQQLYIDGKRVASVDPLLPRRFADEFRIGDHPWAEGNLTRTSSSLIDRVRIYDRALSPEHIAAHYAGDYNKQIPLSAQLLTLKHILDPFTQRVTANVDVSGADLGANDKATVELLQNDKVLVTRNVSFDGSIAKEEIDLAAFKPGIYQLRASVRVGENAPLQTVKSFTLHEKPVLNTEWRGNKLGLGEKIPPPWTPLQVKRNGKNFSVSCWGRTYSFGSAPFPTQITALGQPLLASPVTLKASVAGRELKWTNGQAQLKSSSHYGADIIGRAQAQAGGGTIVLNTKMRLEYDGVVVVDASLEVPAGVKVETVTLDLPVRSVNATYRHRWTSGWEGFSGNVPPGTGVVETQGFTPFTWLGDNDRGLFWFCETGQFWPNRDSANAYETVRNGGATIMRYNLLAQGQTLPANWNYQFGLQATPIKPIPRDWRKRRLHTTSNAGPADLTIPNTSVDILWPNGQPDAHKYFGYPEAANETVFAKRIQESHAKGVKVIPYSTLTQMWAETPEWLFLNREWNILRPTEKTTAFGVNYTPQFEWVTPTSRDYSDWMVWKHHQFMQKYKFDGYYLDQVHPYPTSREEAGGWRNEKGEWQNVYPILAYRDLYRRFYTMVKEANPDAFILSHMSGKMGIPYVGYADAYLDGEHFRGQMAADKNKNSYMDLLTLDAMRAEYMGRQWGLPAYLLPAFYAEDITPELAARVQTPIEPARELAALLMVHDVSLWVLWTNPKPFEDAFKALDAFGYVDSDFIPYFNPTPPATTDMKNVYTSVYKRKDGRALAIVANLSKEDKSGEVTLNAKRIGVSTQNIISWPDRGALQRNGDKITLNIPRQGLPDAADRKSSGTMKMEGKIR